MSRSILIDYHCIQIYVSYVLIGLHMIMILLLRVDYTSSTSVIIESICLTLEASRLSIYDLTTIYSI